MKTTKYLESKSGLLVFIEFMPRLESMDQSKGEVLQKYKFIAFILFTACILNQRQ